LFSQPHIGYLETKVCVHGRTNGTFQ
jgi:hypothetical protein